MTMDFAALPPEVNSGRMYAGAGAGSLVAAASAWRKLAAEWGSTASAYQSVIAELVDQAWQGPASASMAAAAQPYAAWMTTIAGQAAQTAGQLQAAVAAFEQAFAAMVPPQVIAANRALLASLTAHNVFGLNAAAIAANQAQYGEFWAQDAAAMLTYAANSAAATTVPAFAPAPQSTNPAGAGNQAAVASAAAASPAALSAVPNALAATASPTQATPLGLLGEILTSPGNVALQTVLENGGLNAVFLIGAMDTDFSTQLLMVLAYLLPATAGAQAAADVFLGPAAAAASAASFVGEAAVAAPGLASLAGTGVSASLGAASPVGGLSVPASWAAAETPGVRLATALSAGSLSGAEATGGWLGGVPPIGSLVNTPSGSGSASRYAERPKVVVRMPGDPDADAAAAGSRASGATRPLNQCEQRELDTLRKIVTQLENDRDAAARSIRDRIRSGRKETGS